MHINSTIVDPFVGQQADGKTIPFDPIEAIRSDELKVFLFNSPKQLIKTVTHEFQAVCPFSGLPDVASLEIQYYPTGGKCIELKALKYYLVSFKNVGLYQEGCTARIYKDLKEILETEQIVVVTKYNVRGGFTTTCCEGDLFISYEETISDEAKISVDDKFMRDNGLIG